MLWERALGKFHLKVRGGIRLSRRLQLFKRPGGRYGRRLPLAAAQVQLVPDTASASDMPDILLVQPESLNILNFILYYIQVPYSSCTTVMVVVLVLLCSTAAGAASATGSAALNLNNLKPELVKFRVTRP